jgi:hypothetical protein
MGAFLCGGHEQFTSPLLQAIGDRQVTVYGYTGGQITFGCQLLSYQGGQYLNPCCLPPYIGTTIRMALFIP